MGFIDLACAPISITKSLFELLGDERRIRRLLAGGDEKAWQNLVAIWARAQTHYRTPAGPNWDHKLEYVLCCRFVARYPNSESVIARSLADPNPYVCAYSIQAFCRLAHQKGRQLDRTDFPEALFSRTEEICDQVFCIAGPMTLGALAIDAMKPRPKFSRESGRFEIAAQ